MQLANFGGGKAIIQEEEKSNPSVEDEKRWQKNKNKKRVQTRQKKAKARLVEVEKELNHFKSHAKAKPTNSLTLVKTEFKQKIFFTHKDISTH